MKSFKKIISILLCLLLVMPAFTGCSVPESTYTAQFYSQGDLIDEKTLEEGSDVAAPSAPERAGYVFDGWYTDDGAFSVPAPTVMPKGGFKAYAHYVSESTFSVSFETNGGTEVRTVSARGGEKLSVASPTKTGYLFGGWFTDPELTKTLPSMIMPEKNLTLYAKWNKNTATALVTLLVGDQTSYTEVDLGKALAKPAFTLKNYELACWRDASGAAVSFPMTVSADLTLTADYYSSGLETSDLSANEVAVVNYTGKSTEIIIPETLDGKTVTQIGINGVSVFDYDAIVAPAVTSVVLPDTVTVIGDSAFANLPLLSSLVIPAGIESIGKNAFDGCVSLTNVGFDGNENYPVKDGAIFNDDFTVLIKAGSRETFTVPDTVTAVWSGAFVGSVIGKLTVPKSVATIEPNAFASSGIKSAEIELNDAITELPKSLFYGSGALTEVRLKLGQATSLTAIGVNAFAQCVSLTTFGLVGATQNALPDSVVTLGSGAFAGCASLESLGLGGVTALKGSEFSGAGLKTFALPAGMTQIPDSFFAGWGKLTAFTVPESVTRIGRLAFSGCTGLTSLTLGDGITEIGDRAFSNCGFVTVNLEACTQLKTVGDKAFENCSELTRITVPDSVDRIGTAAFTGCSSLTEITIPYVGEYSQAGYRALLEEMIQQTRDEAGNPNLPVEECLSDAGLKWYNASAAGNDAVFMELCSDEQINSRTLGYIFGTSPFTGSVVSSQYYNETDAVEYYLPETLAEVTVTGKYISAFAFNRLSNVRRVKMPNVEIIGVKAFYYNKAVNSVGETAGELNFRRDVPALRKLKKGAFAYSGGIQDGSSALDGFNKVLLGDSVTYIGAQSFIQDAYPSKLTEVRLPKNAGLLIGENAFDTAEALTCVYQDAGDKKAGTLKISDVTLSNYSFRKCSALTELNISGIRIQTIKESGTYWGAAFLDCAGVRQVEMSNVTAIVEDEEKTGLLPGYLFSGCTSLTRLNALGSDPSVDEINVPSGYTEIGPYAFSQLGSKSIRLPESVVKLGIGAFYRSNLREADISYVTEMGMSTFTYSADLTTVTLSDRLQNIPLACMKNCSALTTVKIAGASDKQEDGVVNLPASLSEIGYYAFRETGIKHINLPGTLKTIGMQMFYLCTELESVRIPASIETIGESAFAFTGVKTVEFDPDGRLKTVGDSMFEGCSNLKSIRIPDGTVEMGTFAFRDCVNLERAVLPASMVAFSRRFGFSNCPKLKSITVLGYAAPNVDGGDQDQSTLLRDSSGEFSLNDWKNKGFKIYIPMGSKASYGAHHAVWDMNSVGGTRKLVTREKQGWLAYNELTKEIPVGLYADADGNSVRLDNVGYEAAITAAGSGLTAAEDATAEIGADGLTFTAAGKTYVVSADGRTLTAEGKTLTLVTGAYIRNSADKDLLLQYHDDITLFADGTVRYTMFQKGDSGYPQYDWLKGVMYEPFYYYGTYAVEGGEITLSYQVGAAEKTVTLSLGGTTLSADGITYTKR